MDGKPNRLNPPTSLSAAERAIFFDVVAACDRDHFRPSDLPLLVRYVEAAALGDQAAEQLRLGAVINGKPSPWITVQEKAVRAMVALSMRFVCRRKAGLMQRLWVVGSASRSGPVGVWR